VDGKTLDRELRRILGETDSSTWLDQKTSYDYLWDAAIATADAINAFTTTQPITTISGISTYNLYADFLRLYLRDSRNNFFIKYNAGSNDYFIYWKSYDAIYLANQIVSVPIPDSFTITDAPTIAQMTGNADSTSIGLGETYLNNASADFTNVYPGDYIHNTTDGSNGVVMAVTSTIQLVTALFDGQKNYWSSGDSYVLNPQGRFQMILSPPPSVSGYTVTVPYCQRPNPVYSPYRSYKFAPGYKEALVQYAAWKYKYRDREPNYGDSFYKYWDITTRKLGKVVKDAINRKDFGVNLIKRANRDGTFR
jgi:hypothetical protein